MNKQQKLGGAIVISGPSGVGKSTLINLLRQSMPELEFSVSCTTRSPRPGEVHGKHYYFMDEAEFETKRANGEFIEHAGVFRKSYGTLRSEVADRVRAGRDVILDIDVQGALQIREAARSDKLLARTATFIMIAPPSLDELETRLRGRNTESEEQISIRLCKARHELSFYQEYDFLVANDTPERAAAELGEIIKLARIRCSRQAEGLFDE